MSLLNPKDLGRLSLLSNPKFKYLRQMSEHLKTLHAGEIEVIDQPQTGEIMFILHTYPNNGKYVATLKDKVMGSDEPDFADIYLYAIITIQLILSRAGNPKVEDSRSQAPKTLIADFEEYALPHLPSKLAGQWSYQIIMNGLFNIKFIGDCELNTAFAVYMTNTDKSFNIPFIHNDHPSKNELLEFAVNFKIKEYIMFMKYIVGRRRYDSMIGAKTMFHFDGHMLPKITELPSCEFDINESVSPIHALLISYDKKQMVYTIHDMDQHLPKMVLKLNVSYLGDYEFEAYANGCRFYYAIDNGVGKLVNLNERSLIEIGVINFNQFKYIILNYLITCEVQKLRPSQFTAWELVGNGLIQGTKTDFDLLDKYMNEY